MPDRAVTLCCELNRVREIRRQFLDALDAPLEPGTAEFDQAAALLRDVHDKLDELGRTFPETARGAEAMAIAILAHAGELRPSVYRMVEQIHAYLKSSTERPPLKIVR